MMDKTERSLIVFQIYTKTGVNNKAGTPDAVDNEAENFVQRKYAACTI